jgi:uncharacterized membrane protein
LLLIAAIAISGFAVMDPQRLFHLSLFVLGPFCISGGILFFNEIAKTFSRVLLNTYNNKSKINCNQSMKILYVFFTLFLLFNTRFIYEVTNDHPNSISISQESIKKYGNVDDKATFYRGLIITQDVFSSKWLSANMRINETIHRADSPQGYPDLVTYRDVNESLIKHFDDKTKRVDEGYIQLTYLNIVEKVGSIWSNPLHQITAYDITKISHILFNKHKIYDNGGSQILLV